ncbi:MAG: hypothetical protein ACYDCL_21360 [Myxococcales bacterium]
MQLPELQKVPSQQGYPLAPHVAPAQQISAAPPRARQVTRICEVMQAPPP